MSLLDSEVTYEDAILPDHVGETYRGVEGVARATERWLEPYEEVTTPTSGYSEREGSFTSSLFERPQEALEAVGLRE